MGNEGFFSLAYRHRNMDSCQSPTLIPLKPATRLVLSWLCSSCYLSVDCGSGCTAGLGFQKACGLHSSRPPSSEETGREAELLCPCNYKSCFFLMQMGWKLCTTFGARIECVDLSLQDHFKNNITKLCENCIFFIYVSVEGAALLLTPGFHSFTCWCLPWTRH